MGMAGEPALAKQAREQAVQLARDSHVDRAITALRQLRGKYPNDQRILADLIVLLRHVGRSEEVVALTRHLRASDLPDYAVMAWAGALRDQHQFERARLILEAHARKLTPTGKIFFAMVTSEAGQRHRAVELLPSPSTAGLNATDFAHMAYVYRRDTDAASALRMCARALRMAPQNRLAQQEQIYALELMGSANLAYQLASQHPGLLPLRQMDRLRASATATHIRNGIHQRGYLLDHHRLKERKLPLERALAELNNNIRRFENEGDKAQAQRSRFDRIVVLQELKRMPEAIKAYKAIGKPDREIPVYVRRAAGSAFLYLRHPQRAAVIYQGLIDENPGIDVQVYLGLYYALIECEDYDKALKLIDKLHKVTPAWRRPEPPRRDRVANWERLAVEHVWALDAAYRNREYLADKRLKSLYDRAPYNLDLLNTYATVLRWRGWPEKAAKLTALAQGYAPRNKDTRINVANDARDLGLYDVWGRKITKLRREFPHDTSIAKSNAYWLDRRDPSISSELIVGRSSGGNIVNGNRDRQWNSRLNSPWTHNGWRAYLEHKYLWANFDNGEDSYDRLGAGAEWEWGRKHFWTTVSDDRFTGKNVGVAAGWSQWLNDHWHYSLSADSYSTDTPLRAHQAGLRGRSYNAGINWRDSESRSAYANLGLLAISDGNKRTSFSTGFTQRLQSSAHHITAGSIDLFANHNSRPGGPYFNPEDSRSASLRLQHDWLTWRRYEHSLTQHFDASIGVDWQTGYGSARSYDLLYRHDWRLARTWELHYGLGWGSHVYDGNRENRVYAVVGFSGVF